MRRTERGMLHKAPRMEGYCPLIAMRVTIF